MLCHGVGVSNDKCVINLLSSRSRRSVLHRCSGRIVAPSIGVCRHANSSYGHGSTTRGARPPGVTSASATGSVRHLKYKII